MAFSRLGRRLVTTVTTAVVGALLAGGAPPTAAAPPTLDTLASEDTLSLPVSGQVSLARAEASVPLPTGSRLHGELNPDFTLSGDLLVPPTTVPVRLAGTPHHGDATAEVRVVATAPTETVFADDGSVTVRHTFRLEVPAFVPDASGTSVVNETCRTAPLTVALHGDRFDLFESFTLEGTFALPSFRGCGRSVLGLPGFRDLLMTDLLSGSDNTLSLTVGPLS
ncbi:hypothetical protein [Nocardioides solisilvae]|uniref:hypothetical protein n=1 Tax=Nocardioides solisilvae TaxID=1542435 RepID=UPI000D750409|nr:hypothetical protein [Nocardioides solisilvae]